jgi:hypothetical protein
VTVGSGTNYHFCGFRRGCVSHLACAPCARGRRGFGDASLWLVSSLPEKKHLITVLDVYSPLLLDLPERAGPRLRQKLACIARSDVAMRPCSRLAGVEQRMSSGTRMVYLMKTARGWRESMPVGGGDF